MLPNLEYIKTIINGLKKHTDNKTEGVLKYLECLENKVDSLPQPDWEQNDPTAKGYIKNRPFFVVTENWAPFTFDNWRSSGWLEEAFKIDGTEYRDFSKTYNGPEIVFTVGVYTITVDQRIEIITCDPQCSSLLFWYPHDVINQIEEKFIPDKNGNILNGSSLGSLRTAYAAEEDNSYIIGQYSFAEGLSAKASGYCSHAEGSDTTASGPSSHAEGSDTTASGPSSHAEGYNTTASKIGSHAEGDSTTASGHASHAEGYSTIASGYASHAGGRYNVADSSKYSYSLVTMTLQVDKSATNYSFGTGLTIDLDSGKCSLRDKKPLTPTVGFKDYYIQTKNEGSAYWVLSSKQNQYVSSIIEFRVVKIEVAKFNTPAYMHYATIIGNGTSDYSRSNAYTLDWDGNAWFAGDVYVGSTSGTNKDEGSRKLPTEQYVDSVVSGGLPLGISGATVGQTVKIKAVDENGKPTEWEAVDMKEQVQPDWNQNDSTAEDYVKNRTHYEESAYVDYVLNTSNTVITGFSMAEVGETMTVKINGVESAETVKEAESSISGFSYKYIGNIDIDSMLNGGTGWIVAEVLGHTAGLAKPDTTITVETHVVHKINDKFINFDGFVRTFDYHFKNPRMYKQLYDDAGNACTLYTCDNIILPEVNSQLLGFIDEPGFSFVGATRLNSCYLIGYVIGTENGSNIIVSRNIVIGLNTVEMEEIAADYGFTHTTNPKA